MINALPRQHAEQEQHRDAYVREKGLFRDQETNRLTYYLDCDDVGDVVAKKGIELFAAHYQLNTKEMPVVSLSSDRPDDNEIVKNMRISLHNAWLLSQMQSYQSEQVILQQEAPASGFCVIL